MDLFNDDAEYIDTDWLFDDSFIGFCSVFDLVFD